jgi:Zn finger protein HypA/HybF involved in hydrogenase expression
MEIIIFIVVLILVTVVFAYILRLPQQKTRCTHCGFVTNEIMVGRLCPKCDTGSMLDIDDFND